MICAGIDAGSRTVKVVLVEARSLDVLAAGVMDQGVEQDALARVLLERLLREKGLAREDVETVVATGYGRKLIEVADQTITEITCQAWGVRHRVPEARTIVDIGGQDSKLLSVDGDGRVADFAMNDRCAAGTGRFLEVVATRLGVRLDGLGELADKSRRPAIISSMCVVFAESEIVGLLASGVLPEDIAVGVQAAIASRVAGMSGREVELPVVFTGGVALVPGMRRALESALGKPVRVAPDPQTTAALGAALLAAGSVEAIRTPGQPS
jgi:predicted CoA-substrate-specific enzyme activase